MNENIPYIDIHTHLTHEKFSSDWQQVLQQAISHNVRKIVVNGLEPQSNRQIIKWSETYPEIIAANGIYPLEAAQKCIVDGDLPFAVSRFDVDDEIHFIAEMARTGKIAAVGECGLDGYWVGEKTFAEQERVFKALIDIAMQNDLPLIIHTRKLERRSVEILRAMKAKKVNFHCYGGKTKLALECAATDRWWFSIPANARKNEAFSKMLRSLPEDRILTETDAPFLAPEKGERNEPVNVIDTVKYFAELRSWNELTARKKIYQNYLDLMGS